MKQQNVFNRVTPPVAGIISLLIIIVGSLAAQVTPPQVKGQEITIKGEIIDFWCYMQDDNHGQDHRTCSRKCASMGNPIGFLDEAKGETYVLAGLADYQASHEVRDQLIEKINQTVTITGTLVKKANTQLLYVKSVE